MIAARLQHAEERLDVEFINGVELQEQLSSVRLAELHALQENVLLQQENLRLTGEAQELQERAGAERAEHELQCDRWRAQFEEGKRELELLATKPPSGEVSSTCLLVSVSFIFGQTENY